MKILLTGATGFIGRNLTRVLVAAGHQVIPASRRNGADFARLPNWTDWTPYLEGVEAVINAVGIIGPRGSQSFETVHTRAPSALFRACAEAGVRRVLQLSALGADERAFTDYYRSKRAADDELRRLDLDWFVLRPSLVYGQGGQSSALFMRLAGLPMIPVVGDGRQMIQPVHVSDVAVAVLAALASTEPRQTVDVVGPQRIAFAEWLQLMREAQGKRRAKLLHCPLSLALAFASLGRWLSPMLHPDNLRMLQAGSVADHEPLARLLGRPPLSLDPQLFFRDASILRSVP